ncbi:hypothetical protein [Leptospira brenneri]|uniref:hypothetical protein n=1 Tax=Leptospira brenneri TaxID=2023182 RepID=UPI000C2AA5D3|nr:hypothetical protein [Leptospira brenneri]PJZ46163.1 hypothetical protein CH361_03390 [Leptospira brenneri]
MSNLQYPTDDQIKVEWNKFHTIIICISTICSFVGIFHVYANQYCSFSKLLSIIGLYIDIIGVLIASLKTPHFGSFMDAGELEKKREREEKKWFVRGMYTISVGMTLQVIGNAI